ncbi:helix-turn-helix domain-containing protein [Winogradskya consettensis]|uniref:Transcriptional regulator n=1 Tax=Winogradskya consettensis TaxID=113560 RepID=A0A919VW96_9ACTN|nr:helix-turn-helix domain-containing protein [Actinoplanes consettensis]GIM82003.1 transcriptional regulator [Actinoplanes consettensis]
MPVRQYVCGLDAAVDIIGGKWRVLIVWALQDHSLRFGELKRAVGGVSEKVLVEQLRDLEANGVVSREVYDEARPRVEYSLTPLGHDLNRALVPLGAWGNARLRR